MQYAKECDSKGIEYVGIYQAKMATVRKIRFYHWVFVALYLYQSAWVISTIGEPYRLFLEKADREGFQGTLGCEE